MEELVQSSKPVQTPIPGQFTPFISWNDRNDKELAHEALKCNLDDEDDWVDMLQENPPADADFLDEISSYIDSLSSSLRAVSLKIHDNPELNFHEFIAHATLVEFLKTQKGWTVTPSAYGIPTAFTAELDSGKKGPTISFNAEYDALPGIGHACGHNLIAIGSVSAALAAGAILERHKLSGKVVLIGTPAEEGGGGKIKLLEAGAYKNVDVSIIPHPGIVHDSAIVRTAAYTRFKVEYEGREAHAAASPWEGINALDALIIAYNGISALRQQTMPGDIIQGHITDGGLAPNIIHAHSAGVFVVRANTKARREELKKKVEGCFQAGAAATGATLKITFEGSYDDHVPNFTMGRSYRHWFNKLGGDIPIPELDVIAGATNASSDQGNVSYAVPSLNAGFKIPSERGFGPHNPGFTEAARTMEAHYMALRTGKAMAASGIDILVKDGLLDEIRNEFKAKVGLS